MPKEEGVLGAADCPKQSDRALHRCVEASSGEASRSHTGSDMHPKKVTVKKVTGVELVTLYILN